jgi:hypothetical protein
LGSIKVKEILIIREIFCFSAHMNEIKSLKYVSIIY